VIERLQQFETAIYFAHTGIVAGCNGLGAERHGVIEEGLELDFGVAQHVGVRRAAG